MAKALAISQTFCSHHKQQQNTPLRGWCAMEAALDWYCVHIEHTHLTRAVNETFRNMLVVEFRSINQPRNCHVYARGNPDGGYSYFFSPVAAKHFEHIIGFWEGVGISEPTNLLVMDMIL